MQKRAAALSHHCLLALVPLGLFTSSVAAQSGAISLEEVVVTARKRTESLQSVPIAVTALSPLELENRQIEAVTDLGRVVPNLTTTQASGSPTNTRIFLRGLGQGESSQPTAESAVGMYIDDVYISRSNGANIGLHDLEQIEVLRGPQGTLYGRNSTTGAIKITTRKPTAEPDMNIRLTAGELGTRGASLLGSRELWSGWAGGVSAFFDSQDGYMDRYDLGSGRRTESDLNARESGGGRLKLSRVNADNLSVDINAYYFFDDSDASYVTPMSRTTGEPLINGDIYATATSDEQFADADQYGASINLGWSVSDVDFRSITAYRSVGNDVFIDISGTDAWYIDTEVDSYQVTQEFQVLGSTFEQRVDWIGGLFLMYEDSDSWTRNLINAFVDSVQDYSVTTESYALFGQANWHATSDLDLTLGLRYTLDRKTFDGSTLSNVAFENGANEVSDDFSDVSPKFGIDYTVSEDMLLYAYAAKGFKAGGFQGRALNAADQLEPYDAEDVWTYEVGFKSEWLNRKLRLNASYFLNQFDNLQLNSLNLAAGGGTIIQNAAEAEVDGVELEVNFLPFEHLSLFASYATAWGEYKSLAASVSGVTLDSELPGTPQVNGKLGGEFRWPLSGGELQFGLDYQHTSKSAPGASTSPLVEIPPLDLFNGYVRYASAGDDWSFGVYGTNLGDKEYHYTGFTFSSFESIYAARPRIVRAELTLNF